MKLTDHFGMEKQEKPCGCATVCACVEVVEPDVSVESLTAGFGGHGFGMGAEEEELFEKIESSVANPCDETGVFGPLFTGLMSLISPVLGPLGPLASQGLCSLISSEAGRKKIAQDLADALKKSLAADPSRFMAMNIGTEQTTINHWNRLQKEGEFVAQYGKQRPTAWVKLSGPVLTPQNNLAAASQISSGLMNALFQTEYAPTGAGDGWKILKAPDSNGAMETIDVFSEAFAQALAFAECPEEDLWPTFAFAYTYAMNYMDNKRAGTLYEFKPENAYVTGMSKGHGSYSIQFYTPLSELSTSVQKWFTEQRTIFDSRAAKGYLPTPAKCRQGVGFQLKNAIAPIVGIESLYDIVKRATEKQFLKEAKKDPRYSQVVSQNPELQAYLAALAEQNKTLFGEESDWIPLAMGAGVIVLLALVVRKKKK